MIGQFTMTRNADALAETIRAALAAKVEAREVLEVILQSVVYGGNVVVDFGLKVFVPIARKRGVLEGAARRAAAARASATPRATSTRSTRAGTWTMRMIRAAKR